MARYGEIMTNLTFPLILSPFRSSLFTSFSFFFFSFFFFFLGLSLSSLLSNEEGEQKEQQVQGRTVLGVISKMLFT